MKALRLIGVAAILALAIGGCGAEELTKAEFIAKGDAICRDFDAREERLQPKHDPTSTKATPEDRKQGEKLLAFYAAELPKVAEKFRGLDVRDEEKALKDETARVVGRSAPKFEVARRMLAADRAAEARKNIMEALGPIKRTRIKLKRHGFKDCAE